MDFQTEVTQRIPISDEKIIELFFARDEKAIEETDFKYKNYLYTVAYNIVKDRLDCEECLNDTYLGAWNAIPPARPHVLKAFLTTIMRRVAVNKYHHNQRKNNIPSEMTVSFDELESVIVEDNSRDVQFDPEHLGEVISEFVRSLNKRRKFIFMSRYYLSEPIDKIASSLKVSRSTINKELAFIKSKFKEKLESEGYIV